MGTGRGLLEQSKTGNWKTSHLKRGVRSGTDMSRLNQGYARDLTKVI